MMVSPLANPNLPLGTAEAMAAAAADPAGETGWNPPVSDRNAYANQANGITSGTNAGPSTEVSNAGLNPAAIVGVRLDGSDYSTTTWEADKNAGAQYPVFTGMMQRQYLTSGVNLQVNGSATIQTTVSAQDQFNDINPANTTVYWVGLAISYSETVTMTLNGSTLNGPLGSAPWNDGLFQELNQAITGKLDSGDSYVPGS